MLNADGIDVVESRSECGDVDEIGCAGLKFQRRFLEGGAAERDMLDHLAAALIGRNPVEPFAASPENADALRTIHLVRREGVEIGSELLHVDLEVGYSLSAVDNHASPFFVGVCGHFLHRVYGAEHIGNVAERYHACALGEQ